MSLDDLPSSTRDVRSTVADDATVTITVELRKLAPPGDDEVVVAVGAAPINPSDIGVLFAGGDVTRAARVDGDVPTVRVPLHPAALRALRARVGRAMPAGNEGAGIVVAAGASPRAQALVGQVVAP